MELSEELDRLTDPDGNLKRVDELVYLEDGTLVVVLSGSVGETGTRLFHVPPGASGLLPSGRVEEVDGLWPAGDRVLVAADGGLSLIDLEGKQSAVTALPEDSGSVDVSWTENGLRAGAIVQAAADDDDQIEIYPKARGTVALRTYAPDKGWVERAQIPSGCGGLSISRDGRRLAWREPLNVVPEEAMRGQFRGYDCDRDELVCFTENAGKARQIIVHPAGDGVAYVANFSQDRPVTTHTDLWWQSWDNGERVNLTGGGRSIDGIGWCPDGSSVWVSIVDGTRRVTVLFGLDGKQRRGGWAAQHGGASSDVAWCGGELAFETESAADYPRIQCGSKSITLPQPEAFDDIRCTVHQWTASDGLQVQGVVWDLEGTPGDAPVLVRAGRPSARGHFRWKVYGSINKADNCRRAIQQEISMSMCKRCDTLGFFAPQFLTNGARR